MSDARTPAEREQEARDVLVDAVMDSMSGGPPGHSPDVWALLDAYRDAVEARVREELRAEVERMRVSPVPGVGQAFYARGRALSDVLSLLSGKDGTP